MDWIVQTMVLEEGQLHVGVPKGGGVDQRFLIDFVVSSRQVVDEVELGGLSDDCEKKRGGSGRNRGECKRRFRASWFGRERKISCVPKKGVR